MPSRETVWFVPLIIVGLIVGAAFTMFTPIFGIPILALVALFFLIVTFTGRASDTRRANDVAAKAEPDVAFTEEDRRTLTPNQ